MTRRTGGRERVVGRTSRVTGERHVPSVARRGEPRGHQHLATVHTDQVDAELQRVLLARRPVDLVGPVERHTFVPISHRCHRLHPREGDQQGEHGQRRQPHLRGWFQRGDLVEQQRHVLSHVLIERPPRPEREHDEPRYEIRDDQREHGGEHEQPQQAQLHGLFKHAFRPQQSGQQSMSGEAGHGNQQHPSEQHQRLAGERQRVQPGRAQSENIEWDEREREQLNERVELYLDRGFTQRGCGGRREQQSSENVQQSQHEQRERHHEADLSEPETIGPWQLFEAALVEQPHETERPEGGRGLDDERNGDRQQVVGLHREACSHPSANRGYEQQRPGERQRERGERPLEHPRIEQLRLGVLVRHPSGPGGPGEQEGEHPCSVLQATRQRRYVVRFGNQRDRPRVAFAQARPPSESGQMLVEFLRLPMQILALARSHIPSVVDSRCLLVHDEVTLDDDGEELPLTPRMPMHLQRLQRCIVG